LTERASFNVDRKAGLLQVTDFFPSGSIAAHLERRNNDPLLEPARD